jgi:hypothetical protein
MVGALSKKLGGGSGNKKKEDSAWKQFWKNRRHNQIYYFSSAVLALVLVFAINLIGITVLYNRSVDAAFAGTTVFSPNVRTSLSGVPIQVMLCRVNEEQNQMFILLQISDLTNISSNLDNYEIWVTNADRSMNHRSTPSENLRGQFYLFGATGYAGVYLYVDGGTFSRDFKWITIRNYVPVTNNRRPHVRLVADDERYDQFHLFVNPRSESVRTIDFLENNPVGARLDSTEIYRHAISESLESEIKENIRENLRELEDVRLSIGEYRRRLSEDYNLEVPDVAPIMAGDTIETVDLVDDFGDVVEQRREFRFAAVVPGGVNLDWRDLSLRTGYFQSFHESNTYSLQEFLTNLRDAKSRPHGQSVIVQPRDWFFADGTQLDTALASMAPVVSEINIYNRFLNEYMRLKTAIQADLFVQLLELELNTITNMATARVLTDREADDGTLIPALQVW